MKLLKLYLFIFTLMHLNGCASPRAVLKMPVISEYSSYVVGESLTRGLNMPMLSRVEAMVFKAYVATKDVSTPWGLISKGSRWEALHFFEQNDILTSASYVNRGIGFLVDYKGNPVPDKPMIGMSVLDKNPINRPIPGTYRHECPDSDGLFAALERGTVDPNHAVKREVLVYAGMIQQEILLYYVEYINNLSRPTVHQTARYDLSNGEILSFNRFKIRVVKADKREIVFEALE